jgi:hypothetical protein
VESIPFSYYSVFQVKHDPGVGWVYAGFLLFLPGLYLAFFRPVERWALVVAKRQGKWQGRLLGASPRHREEFAARQERLHELARDHHDQPILGAVMLIYLLRPSCF